MVTATKQKSSAHAADVLSVSQTALIGNSFLKCKQMSSASTLLTLFSHSQTDVVKDRDTASSFSRSSNCIFWCDACGKQSSALFSTSEIYHWADIDLMEESPEGNTIKLDFN